MLSKLALSLAVLSLAALDARGELPRLVTNELYVSDYSNDRVAVYSPDGTYLRAFATPGMNGPRGIVFADDGSFFVVSQINSTVYHFGRDETVQNQFSHALLTSPTGAALSPAGELHVGSFNGARICVFSQSGTFLRSYTAPGFSTPNCVAFDTAGNAYAASAGNGSVFKFDVNENFVAEFDVPTGFSLTSPMSVTFDRSGTFWVSGGSSDNLVQFTTDGTFLGEITHPDLTGPQGIALDDRGHMFSTSFYQDVIVEFDASGAYVRTIATGGLSVPRSIAFDPGRIDLEFPSLCDGDGGDGMGCTACPCGNDAPGGTTGGCLNSGGESARLHVFGSSSVAASNLRFELDRGVPTALAVLVSGAALAPTNPMNPCFGLNSGFAPASMDGLRCAVTDFRRHGSRSTDAEGRVGSMGPGWGGQDAPPAGILNQAGFVAGADRHFQVFYRDLLHGTCTNGLNTTQARSLTVAP